MNRTTLLPLLCLFAMVVLVFAAGACADHDGGQSGSGLSCAVANDCGNGFDCIDEACVATVNAESCQSLDACECLASSKCVPVTETCFCASEDTTCPGYEDEECLCSGGAFLGCEARPTSAACESLDACGCLASSDCTAVTETCFCPATDSACSGYEDEECICSGGEFLACQTAATTTP